MVEFIKPQVEYSIADDAKRARTRDKSAVFNRKQKLREMIN